MMRKQLGAPEDLESLPSYLGHVFRLAYFGFDSFDYSSLLSSVDDSSRDQQYGKCRAAMGMHSTPDKDYENTHRQQYSKHHLP